MDRLKNIYGLQDLGLCVNAKIIQRNNGVFISLDNELLTSSEAREQPTTQFTQDVIESP